MKKKCKSLSARCFLLSLLSFAVDYVLFHYVTADGTFTTVFQQQAGKPYVTLYVGILGVLFLFASLLSLLIAGTVCKEM